MKTIILFLSVIISSASFSQDDTTQVSNCQYFVNEVDEFTGVSKKIVKSELLIAHTDSILKKYYKMKPHEYIECGIECGKIDELYAVYITWRIDTDEAYKYYGIIPADAKFIIKFTDGSTIILNYAKTVTGDTDFKKKFTTYMNFCQVDEKQKAELESKSVEKIRMYWSEGYTDYSVINSEVFKTQFNCLK